MVEEVEGPDMSGAEAASRALGEDVDAPEPSDAGMQPRSKFRRALMSEDPHRPIEQIEPPAHLRDRWRAYLWRAFQKITGVAGNWAVLDLLLGAIGALFAAFSSSHADEDGAGPAAPAGAGEDVPIEGPERG